MDIKIDEKKKTITIVAPLEEPTPSSTGKSLLLTSSGGFSKTLTQYKGKQVSLNLVVCIPNK